VSDPRPSSSNFEDRWPAILHCFELGYRHGGELWKMPQPLIQSLHLLEVG
jgi:hypothetical protein